MNPSKTGETWVRLVGLRPVYPGCDTVLAQLCKTVPQGEMGKGYAGSLCIISYDTSDYTHHSKISI